MAEQVVHEHPFSAKSPSNFLHRVISKLTTMDRLSVLTVECSSRSELQESRTSTSDIEVVRHARTTRGRETQWHCHEVSRNPYSTCLQNNRSVPCHRPSQPLSPSIPLQ